MPVTLTFTVDDLANALSATVFLADKQERAEAIIERLQPVEHSHHHSGQTLTHSHPGGALDHGYFEHPEDVRS